MSRPDVPSQTAGREGVDADHTQSPRRDGRRESRRCWPAWCRVLAAVLIVVAFFKVYAGWHFSPRVGKGPGVTFSPTKSYVGMRSAFDLAVNFSIDKQRQWNWPGRFWGACYWRLTYVLATILPASLIGVVSYAWLTRRYGQPPDTSHSVCRRCGYILNGLSRPQCPECGEMI